ncbi:(Fe-S)-binding protein [Rhodocaloribacter litoris]|uniref:(Fe-S)-binding protein n=1 Tax=Rhodocaloribacter litoris TaxID=2558931 RepID=UPI0014244A46|nr:(Fe-S)-binding protein [Rhodocaloribacter litoris]QXD15390.1 (Fe-S)-binding protein [Rhodocaloribacter litoris]
MRVGLFIPCYLDQLYPEVAVATLAVLEGQGLAVDYPLDQTCCGQPMANAGCADAAEGVHRHFRRTFDGFDTVVAPSGSCVLHVRRHVLGTAATPRVFELCEFLVDVLKTPSLNVRFPYRVGVHAACHGLRGLRLGAGTERRVPPFDKVAALLDRIDGLERVSLDRPDECCGFGGTFAVGEEAVSVRMGRDRLQDHLDHGVEVITSTDMSCLMHLDGLIRRERRLGRLTRPLQVMHVAEILAGVSPAEAARRRGARLNGGEVTA